jgi:hypothetical protein
MFSLKNALTPNFTKKLQAVSTNKYKKKGQFWYFSRQSQKFTTSLTLNNLQSIVQIHQSLRTKLQQKTEILESKLQQTKAR